MLEHQAYLGNLFSALEQDAIEVGVAGQDLLAYIKSKIHEGLIQSTVIHLELAAYCADLCNRVRLLETDPVAATGDVLQVLQIAKEPNPYFRQFIAA